ncbi:MAG TPA: histidine kinase, partial [Telluria sp.]|nr:histidine kinase [Telluria sp.]
PANPRLGVDHTVTGMMERTRAFFGAERCVLLLRFEDGCTVRTVHEGSPLSVPREPIGEESAAAFLGFAPESTLLYRHGRLARPLASYPLERRHWVAQPPLAFERVADLLEADTFISAPVVLARASGRLFVSRSRHPFTRSDALFLSQAVAQAVPVVENLAMLDRMATEAAWTERQRFALNVHDTAVQPYIGLALGLAALRRKADPDNPLVPELEALGTMVQSVITDLRAYAGSVACRDGDQHDGALCGAALARLVAQMKERYGLQVKLNLQAGVELGDRLAAEVIQIVREGLNNIGKHTRARQSEVHVRRAERVLQIEIDNEAGDKAVAPFIPHSIQERAAVLGGTVHVRSAPGATAVCVEIPI